MVATFIQEPAMQALTRLFTDHPGSVEETYFEHMRFAFSFAGLLFLAATAALCHAVLPFTFEKTASGIINRLHHRMHNRSK
jgi:uncharacterized protein DUF6356